MSRTTQPFAGLLPGRKYRRSGGGRSPLGRERRPQVPLQAAQSRGLRFSCDAATPAQLKSLDNLIVSYLRTYVARRFPDLPVECLSSVFGLGERQTQTIVSRARNEADSSDAFLGIELLHGMHSGKYAGVLGTPKYQTTRWLFGTVHYFDWRDVRFEGACDQDHDAFRTLHGAFQIDYTTWLRGR